MKLLQHNHRQVSATEAWQMSKTETPPSLVSGIYSHIHQTPRKWDRIKLVLRSISTLLAITVLGESIHLNLNRADYFWPITPNLPVGAVILLWDIVESVVILARHDISHGIPPAAHVGAELILTLAIFVTIVLTATEAAWSEIYFEAGTWLPICFTELAFRIILLITRLVLLVRACVEVHEVRKSRKNTLRQYTPPKQDRITEDLPLTTFHGATTSKQSTNTSLSTAMERDFEQKYNFSGLTAAELLEPPTNQKVLVGPPKPLRRSSI